MALEKWDIDYVHSSINFSVRHLMISKVHGRFSKWTGTLEFDEQNPSKSRVDIRIDASSIDTKEAQRDDHLRSPDFLEVAKYPEITFRSKSVEDTGDSQFRVKGDLTIRGITLPATLDTEYGGRVKDVWGGDRAGFSARVSVNRKDFGLTWNQLLETGGIAVGEKVEINIDIEAVNTKAAAAGS
jgi:polyisoprenoid-binding protein YceI